MATNQIPLYRRVEFDVLSDGTLRAKYHWTTYRFLMSDGSSVDVVAVRDDSDLRGALLEHTKCGAIAGSVSLPYDEEPVPVKKKTIGRKRGASPVPS